MKLTRKLLAQLITFGVVSTLAAAIMIFGYMDLPNLLFGARHFKVTLELPAAAGLYQTANVTYRGTEVGRVDSVGLTDTGVQAVLSLNAGVRIPADLDAQVHSQSAVGEQYVLLLPRNGDGPVLKNGDVIPRDRTTVPPDINSLLGAANQGLQAIPRDNLKTTIDEAYTAVGGLGPDIARLVKGSTSLAIDARKNLDSLTNLIDNSQPLLDSQGQSAPAIQAWASNLATITDELRTQDGSARTILQQGPAAADEVRAAFDRVNPTLPTLLANLTSITAVGVVYNANLEQTLTLVPVVVADVQSLSTANRDNPSPYAGAYLSFNLNLNLPPPCNTGFLPIQQQRPPTFEDTPDRPAGDIYCRVPQDSQFNVRGVRNTPCETKPGKRAPTVVMCESDEQYVPLNDGYNWKGDPNATLSGQDIPQLRTGSPGQPAPPAAQGAPPAAAPPIPIPAAEYDPATGTYLAPDGHVYTQSNLAAGAKTPTWQDMLLPPKGN